MSAPGRLAERLLFAAALLVVIALYLADTVGPIPLALFVATVPVAWRWPARPEHAQTWTAVTVLFLVYAVINGYLAGTAAGVAESTLHFLLYLLINKLFHRGTTRDRIQLLLLTLLGLLAVAGVTEELLFASVFLLYVALGVTALLFIHLADAPTRAWRRAGRLPAGLAWVAGGSSLLVFLLAALVFLLVPRIGLGLFFSGRSLGASLAGFGDRIALGDLSSVRGGRRVVARVEFPDRDGPPPPDQRYFRGGGYSRYDGQTWRVAKRDSRRLKEDPARPDVYPVYEDRYHRHQGRLRDAAPGADLLRQRIYAEPLGINVMPVADRVLDLTFHGPTFAAPRSYYMIFVDVEGAIRVWRPSRGSLQYEARSDITRPRGRDLRGQGRDYPDPVRADNLDLAAVSPRVCELAETLAGSAIDPYDQARALETALEQRYAYAEQDVASPEGTPPLENFLFHRRAGHCEYFASALALMLRCLGVPTRNVTGFFIGEWNAYGDYLALRESDAHAWTEVYFPRSGWTRFDATPAAERDLASLFDDLYDAARLLWFRHVIEYDLNRQMRALQTIVSASPPTHPADGGDGGVSLDAIPAHLGAALLAAVGLLVIWLLARRRGRVVERARREHPATRLYLALERGLARRGLVRDRAETPRRFAARAARSEPALAALIQEITDLHERVRYSGRTTPADGWAAVHRRLRDGLRAAAR